MSIEIDTITLLALAGVGMVMAALLYAWQGWLNLKNRELDMAHGAAPLPAVAPATGESGDAPAAARIELADLKERVRRLEAIASGVDL